MPLLAWLLLTLFTSLSHAHPLDLGLLNLTQQAGHVHARLEVNPQVAARLLLVGMPILENSLPSLTLALFQRSLKNSNLTVGGQTCTWREGATSKIENAQLLAIEADADCDSLRGTFRLELSFLKNLDRGYRVMYMARINDTEHVGDAVPATPVIAFVSDEASLSLGNFIQMGMQHIGMTPDEWHDSRGFHLPRGTDHILFVLALLFSGASLIPLMKTVTGFTIGHTLSLVLASLGVIQFSGRWIEAAIALTIAGVALDSAIKPGGRAQHRWKVTVGIGLIHGLGFAAALGNLDLRGSGLVLSILGFNLGVEIGQLLLVAIALPALLLLRRWKTGYLHSLRMISALIFLIGSYWFIQRAFL